MDGFLPLIEAFLAFALTMVALTTAVSAIVGIFHRLLRLRARGLRQMMDYYFRNEIIPFLQSIRAKQTAQPKKTDAIKPVLDNPHESKIEFLVDMTLVPAVVLQRGAESERAREALVERDTWQSLAHGLDTLTSEEFAKRLKASRVGHILEDYCSSTGQAFDDWVTLLEERFASLSGAASERFMRSARIWTVVTGFLLAFGINIDTFNLLNSYMTNPQLRASVIERADQILESPQGGGAQQQGAGGASVDKLTEAVKRAKEAVPSDSAAAAALRDVTQTADELVKEARNVQSIALGLTESFPIGWGLYPNCTQQRETVDLRCLKLASRSTGSNLAMPASFGAALRFVWDHDASGFIRWIIGVLLTGLLLGLGTPFWVQAVNSMLRARGWMRGDKPGSSQKPDSGKQTPTGQAGGQAGAGQG